MTAPNTYTMYIVDVNFTLLLSCFRFMLSVSHTFVDSTRIRLSNARKSKEKREEEKEKLKSLMKSLKDTFDLRSRSLKAEILDREQKFKEELLQHLKSADARRRMADVENDAENYGVDNFNGDLFSKANSDKEIRMKLMLFTQYRLQREISWWNQKDAITRNPETGAIEMHHENSRFSLFMASIKNLCYDTFAAFEKHASVMKKVLAVESLLEKSQVTIIMIFFQTESCSKLCLLCLVLLSLLFGLSF